MTATLTSSGLTVEDFDTIKEDITSNVVADFPLVNTTSASLAGNYIAQIATKVHEIQQLIEAVYNSFDVDSATGSSLDARGRTVGVTRNPATKATVTLTVDLDATTTLPEGSIARKSSNPSQRFVTIADVTSTTAGEYTVAAEAEVAGLLAVPTNSVDEIAVPVSGWNTVDNAAAGASGTDEETDAAYRLRIRSDVSQTGKANFDSILRSVQEVEGLSSASMLENSTDVIDGNGLPPHSIELIVVEGTATDNEIAQAIFDVKAAGIETYSDSADSGSAVDLVGDTHTIDFTKATTNSVDVSATYTYLADLYPGDDIIEDAITTYLAALVPGNDVIYNKVIGVIYEAGAGSIIDISALTLDGSAVTFVVSARAKATAGSISLTSDEGTLP